jgi:signal transduction histidine kinase
VVAGCTAVAIVSRLSGALRAAEQDSAEMMGAYMQVRRDIEALEHTYQKRLHDARSAAASVHAAIGTLDRKASERASASDAAAVRWVIASEMQRLEAMLQSRPGEQSQEFDIAEVLNPIVLAHRITGAHIDSGLQPARVHGFPQATAAVADNLLRNARIHSPGARIWLRTVVDDDFATVIVDDEGPGIPDAEWDKVLLPGFRGTDVVGPGTGLGLHIAATAIAEQYGRLEVGRSVSGGTRVTFALPLAACQSAVDGADRRLAS